MTPPGHKAETLRDLITGELEDAVDQACDINFLEYVETKPIPKSVDESRRALNLFPTRGAADTLTALSYRPNATSATIVTNPLDEEQQQKIAQEEVAKRQSRSMAALQASRDYTCKRPSVEKHFDETIDQTLALWIIGREATSPEDSATRTALRKHYLEPDYMSRSQYKERLVKQARGASVPAMRGVPIILAEGEQKSKEDKDFVRWVHKARHVSSMYALRASASVADVRLERRLRFDYAKLKARYQIKPARARYAPVAQHLSASATHVAASSRQAVAARLPAGEKRHRSQDDPERDIQKRQRCKGNLAAGVSQTPMTSLTQDTHVTSPDTGFDHDDDASKEISPDGTKGVSAYQSMPAEAGVSVKAPAESLQEVNGLRAILTQTRSALGAVQTRLQTLEQQQLRLEGQLDILIRMLQPAISHINRHNR